MRAAANDLHGQARRLYPAKLSGQNVALSLEQAATQPGRAQSILTDFLNLVAKESIPDQERDALRRDAYQRANSILHAHKAKVEAVAERLMEHGQMNGSEFLELMRG